MKNLKIPLPLRTEHRLDGLETAYCGGGTVKRQILNLMVFISFVAVLSINTMDSLKIRNQTNYISVFLYFVILLPKYGIGFAF